MTETQHMLPFLATLAIVTLAVYTDSKRGIIPNRLTIPSMIAGLALNTFMGGWDGLAFSAQGLALGFGLLLVPFLVAGMGAGDVKLLAAVGALMGPSVVLSTFTYGAVLGGAVALLIICRTVGWRSLFVSLAGGWRRMVTATPGKGTASFPFAASLWFGVLVTVALR